MAKAVGLEIDRYFMEKKPNLQDLNTSVLLALGEPLLRTCRHRATAIIGSHRPELALSTGRTTRIGYPLFAISRRLAVMMLTQDSCREAVGRYAARALASCARRITANLSASEL